MPGSNSQVKPEIVKKGNALIGSKVAIAFTHCAIAIIMVGCSWFSTFPTVTDVINASTTSATTAIPHQRSTDTLTAATEAVSVISAADMTNTATAKETADAREITAVVNLTNTAIAKETADAREATAVVNLTNTAIAKETAVAKTATAVASPSNTPIPTPTPVLLVLLEPKENAEINVNQIRFTWEWKGTPLAANERFALRMWHLSLGSNRHSITWVEKPEYILTLDAPPVGDIDFSGGCYYWNIGVVRELCPDHTKPGCWEARYESEPRRIYIKASAISPAPPTPRPTDTPSPTPRCPPNC